jgi:hypothetical protein
VLARSVRQCAAPDDDEHYVYAAAP